MDAVWPWLMIVLLLAIGFGPVYWFRPSARERRIASMRQHARERGLFVELQALPDTEPTAEARVSAGGVVRDATIACAVYRRYTEAPTAGAPRWRVRRTALALPGPAAGWRWDTVPGQDLGDAKYWQRVTPLIAQLPDDCQALEAHPVAVSCAWQERAGAQTAAMRVDAIADVLQELVELQREFSRL